MGEAEHGCLYRGYLTVDAAQGEDSEEAPIVTLLLTKPGEVGNQIRFVSNKERLNLVLSGAQKALVVINNARLWPKQVIKNIERLSHNKFCAGVFRLLTSTDNRQVVESRLQAGPVTSSNTTLVGDPMDVDNTSGSIDG